MGGMKLNTLLMLFLLFIILIITIESNTFQGITGAQSADESGIATVEITGAIDIYLTVNGTDFGQGYVNTSHNNATIESAGPSKVNWINDTSFGAANITSMEIINNGTLVANVTIKTSNNATEFIGGTSPLQLFKATNNETSSCAGTLTSSYTALTKTPDETVICDQLNFLNTKDSLNIDFNLTIPADATSGAKTNTITFTGKAYTV